MKTLARLFFLSILVLRPGLDLQAGDFKHIVIDGSFDDWAGIAPAYVDLSFQDDPAYQQDPAKFAGATDLKAIYVAHDDQYLYVRFTLYAPGVPFTSINNVFVDADNDPGTGYSAEGLIGSEMLIQSGTGYQEKNGTFNDGFTINGLNWQAAPAGSSTDFEFRISRQARYADNALVFNGTDIAFILEAENENFATVDVAPDAAGLVYTFTPAPPPATNSIPLITLTGSSWRVNDSGADLNTAWRDPAYDDTQAGWSSGQGLFGFTTNSADYPAPIQKPLASGRSTYYLRNHFQWTNDPANVILVASNYLSDGAVFYLNGVEVERVRLPNGTVAFNTPATGGPAVKGQSELAGIPTAPLVIGENILAVEVHQSAGDTADLVFGSSLIAATKFPVVITDPSQPADRTVGAGNPTTFAAKFVGSGPLTFQWFKGANQIPDATNATLTIDPALPTDAGSYILSISNPLSSNVITRAALLTITNTAVRIVDPSEPADRSVTEGLPVTFSVSIAGSAPLSFQWFKGLNEIPDATNQTYTIPSVATGDAGDYHVVVTNPYPSSVTSRTAHLTVTADTTGPVLLAAVGTPNRVTLTFSEQVSPASAGATNHFSLSGGLQVLSAAVDPGNPNAVILTTSPQTLGTTYTVTVNQVADRFNNLVAPNSQTTFKSGIVIDGSFDDWASVPLAFTDPQDSTESTDYKDVYITNDDDFIYMRVTLHTPSTFSIFYNNIFVDADNDATTGYSFSGIGSDMLIQEGSGYQEKNGGFNEGGIDNLNCQIQPDGVGTNFELRISRHATYASDGLPVFTTNSFTFALESENTGFVAKDIAPDSGGFSFTYLQSQLGPLTIVKNGSQITISWTGTGRLQTRSSLSTGTWADVSNATNPYSITTTGPSAFYRLIQ